MAPLRAIAEVEAMPGWWNSIGAWRTWFITGVCGHSVLRRRKQRPKRFRCEVCDV